MQDSILGPWRDVSIVILIIPMIVMVLIPGVLFYYAIRGVRWVKHFIRVPLLTVRLWAMRLERGTERASRATVTLPIAVEALKTRAWRTASGLAEYLGTERSA